MEAVQCIPASKEGIGKVEARQWASRIRSVGAYAGAGACVGADAGASQHAGMEAGLWLRPSVCPGRPGNECLTLGEADLDLFDI